MDKALGSARVALDLLRAQREGASGLARRQEDRLVALVTYARAKSRYYERLYRDLPNDPVVLRDLPPVAKPELMASFDDWVTDPEVTRAGVEAFIAHPACIGTPFLGRNFVCKTSGTTGTPACSYMTERCAASTRRSPIALTWRGCPAAVG